MYKAITFTVSVTVAIFAAGVYAAGAQTQGNHQRHHKMAGTSSKSGKSVSFKKTNTANKQAMTMDNKSATKATTKMNGMADMNMENKDIKDMAMDNMMSGMSSKSDKGSSKGSITSDKPGMSMKKKGGTVGNRSMNMKKKPAKKAPSKMNKMKDKDKDMKDMDMDDMDL